MLDVCDLPASSLPRGDLRAQWPGALSPSPSRCSCTVPVVGAPHAATAGMKLWCSRAGTGQPCEGLRFDFPTRNHDFQEGILIPTAAGLEELKFLCCLRTSGEVTCLFVRRAVLVHGVQLS